MPSPAINEFLDLEEQYRFHLFTRNKRRVVELTDAGRVFVEEARSAVSHTERAVHFAGAAHEGSDSILTIGHSPYANHDWISALFAIRLPLYPRLTIRLKTQFDMESVHSVLVGDLNLALVTAPPQDAQITAVSFAPAQLYAVLPEAHAAAHKKRLLLHDLAKDEWILFGKRVHPRLYEAIMDTARRGSEAYEPQACGAQVVPWESLGRRNAQAQVTGVGSDNPTFGMHSGEARPAGPAAQVEGTIERRLART